MITLQPQSPNYPEYSTAIYTVKAEGTNLQATWYLEWGEKTYNISDTSGAMQPWEAFAGETYGAQKLDDNTFVYIFGGIEYDMDGSYIWCVIEDGHYSVTSQKNRVSVGNPNTPPEIVSIPVQLTVEQGEEAQIRCVAKAPEGTQLSFLWYETETGKRQDIFAVNDGTETADFLLCDTSKLGTRNYICKVDTSEGGMAYSSVVSVTVVEKQPEASEPSEPTEASTQPTEAPTQPTEASTQPTAPPEESTPETQAPTAPPAPDTQQKDEEVSWPLIVVIAVVAAGVGFGAAMIVMKKKA